jgi:hypothetical protein
MNSKNSLLARSLSRLSRPNLKNQIIKIWPTVIFCLLLAVGGAGFTLLVSQLTGFQVWKLARDPAEVMGFPPYIGMLSNWSAMLWVSAAAICLFGAAVLKKHAASAGAFRFMGISGAFSLFLGLDDLFMLHDRVLPKLLNAPEEAFYFLYLIAILAYLVMFLPRILEYDFLLLGAAVLLFGLSRRTFIILPWLDRFITISDMLKYFGILFWLAFFYRMALQEVGNLLRPARE